jgi:hypothetical protein
VFSIYHDRYAHPGQSIVRFNDPKHASTFLCLPSSQQQRVWCCPRTGLHFGVTTMGATFDSTKVKLDTTAAGDTPVVAKTSGAETSGAETSGAENGQIEEAEETRVLESWRQALEELEHTDRLVLHVAESVIGYDVLVPRVTPNADPETTKMSSGQILSFLADSDNETYCCVCGNHASAHWLVPCAHPGTCDVCQFLFVECGMACSICGEVPLHQVSRSPRAFASELLL